MKISLKFTRKQNYIIYATLSSVALGSIWALEGIQQRFVAILAVLIVILGSLFVQRKNLLKENFLYVVILPTHLAIGVVLSILYFPNLGLLVKFGSLIFIGIILYIISLVNNVFLVVVEKKSVIPLFRVAATWLLILLIVAAIPFYTGIFKLPLIGAAQLLIIGISTLMLTLYTVWATSLDPDAQKPNSDEILYLCLVAVFLVVVGGISISFIPTEPFLSALFISTLLMFALGYIQAHLKNLVTKRLVFEYFLISATFFAILVLFNP